MRGLTKSLTTLTHIDNFQKWKVDPRVAQVVENTCFRSFLHINFSVIRHDTNLITALVASYNKEKHAFIIGGKNVYFTLEDIFFITGLQIDGHVVSGYETSNTVEECMRHLGLNDKEARNLLKTKQNKVCLRALKEILKKFLQT